MFGASSMYSETNGADNENCESMLHPTSVPLISKLTTDLRALRAAAACLG